MTDNQLYVLSGDEVREPLHYTVCGLDDVYLLNGYTVHLTPDGEGVAIKNLDGLHRTIGLSLTCRKKLLSGKEVRYLRIQMDLTQSEVGRLIGYSAQQVARWEKDENKIPGSADRLIRVLYQEAHLEEDISVRDLLEYLDALDGTSEKQLFEIASNTSKEWRNADAA